MTIANAVRRREGDRSVQETRLAVGPNRTGGGAASAMTAVAYSQPQPARHPKFSFAKQGRQGMRRTSRKATFAPIERESTCWDGGT